MMIRNRELDYSKTAQYFMNSNVILVKFDEISLLKLHLKAHDVFFNLIQSISHYIQYRKRGIEWYEHRTKIKKIGVSPVIFLFGTTQTVM